VAVVQGLEDYEILEEKVAFMQAVAKGLMEATEGKVSLTDSAVNDLRELLLYYEEQSVPQAISSGLP
jgi:hypothetical protein